MKTLLATSALLVIMTGAASGGDNKDEKHIQGTWIAKSIEYGGEQVLDDAVKNLKLVITGNKISVSGEGTELEKYAKATFKINPSTMPKIIDVTMAAGDDKGIVYEGIYQLKGDELKMCVRMIGKERPSEFATKEGSHTALVVFTRQK